MSRLVSRLSLNQKLALLAFALGAVALLADVAPARTVTVHEKELLTAVARQEDHVTAAELATWIVEGRGDYRLVDIRDERAFAEYHIPTAENVPLATVADGSLARTDRIVLYGDGAVHAAQAWMVLEGKGYTQVDTLREGLDAWKSEVLFPVAPADPTPEQLARFERAAQVAKFFGGQPRAATGAEGPAFASLPGPAALPAAAAPVLPAGAGASPARRKKREGC